MSDKRIDSTEIRKEIRITHISLSITLIVCVLLSWDLIGILSERLIRGEITNSLLQLMFIAIISFLLYGSFVYHLSRLGHLKRRQMHQPKNLEILESIYEKQAPSLAILVPSYKEDTQVITKTLLSVALLNYPSKQVVLLIDNPPAPNKASDRVLLDKTRELPQKIHAMLEIPACHFRREFNAFVHRQNNHT